MSINQHLVDVETLGVGNEGASADDVKSGDTEEAVRVVHAGGLEDLDPKPGSPQHFICSMGGTKVTDLGGDGDG